MKSSSNKFHERFKDYDFSDAKPVAQTPHLAKLQALAGKKARITIRVDAEVLAAFKARAGMTGANYQTLMNDALKESVQGVRLADVVCDAVRKTLGNRLRTRSRAKLKKLPAG